MQKMKTLQMLQILLKPEVLLIKKHLNKILNGNIYQEVLPPFDPDWIRFFEMDLNLYYTVDPRVLILKGTVKIKQYVATKSNCIGNVPLKQKPTCPILLFI